MDREKMLRMAREAGLIFGEPFGVAHIARFAELVRADEREGCARVIEAGMNGGDYDQILYLAAKAIRAIGKQEKV